MTEPFTSRLKGLYNQSLEGRVAIIAQKTGLTEKEKETLTSMMGLGCRALRTPGRNCYKFHCQ